MFASWMCIRDIHRSSPNVKIVFWDTSSCFYCLLYCYPHQDPSDRKWQWPQTWSPDFKGWINHERLIFTLGLKACFTNPQLRPHTFDMVRTFAWPYPISGKCQRGKAIIIIGLFSGERNRCFFHGMTNAPALKERGKRSRLLFMLINVLGHVRLTFHS